MDPELKAYLDEIRRDMATKADLERMATKDDLAELDRQNRVLHEQTQGQIRAAEEGRQIILEHVDRGFSEQERRFDERAGRTEAVVSGFVRRVRPLEERVTALEDRVTAIEQQSR